MAKAGVRGDIQGLRAIAVLSVVASHAGMRHLPGGYVGVDVFFVISGYLITLQLLREAEGNGRVSLLGFYARRARRILPAATVVLVATLAYAAGELGVISARSIAQDAVWASLFAANIHFARVGADYFAQGLPPSPLQHFWSLSVEEQFYLVWPLLLMLIALVAFRAGGRTPRPAWFDRGFVAVLSVIVAASLAWSVWSTHHDASAAYFSTLARGWELGLGCAAAYLTSRKRFTLPRPVRQLAGLAGIVLIAYACIRFTSETGFPGSAALVPVVGSALLLVAGAGAAGVRDNLVGTVISVPPLRAIGDWSYSLYLWHYPFLVLPEIHAGHALSERERLLLVLAAIVVSALSYHLIENPFRRARTWRISLRAVALYPASVAIVAACAACAGPYAEHALEARGHQPAIGAHGVPKDPKPGTLDTAQLHKLVRASVKAALAHKGVPTDLHPSVEHIEDSIADLGACDYSKVDFDHLCPHGDLSSTKTVVMYGNSHGRHWLDALDQVADSDHLKVYYLVLPQCTGSLVTTDVAHGTAPFTRCDQFHTWALREIRTLHPMLTIVSSNPVTNDVHVHGRRVPTGPEQARLEKAGYVKLFRALVPSSQRVVLLRDIPQLQTDPGTCLSIHADLGACMTRPGPWQRSEANLQADAARSTKVKVVSMDDFFCWHNWCPAVVGDIVTHRDKAHMTNEWAAQLSLPLGRRLGLD